MLQGLKKNNVPMQLNFCHLLKDFLNFVKTFWDVQKDYEGKKETTRMQKLTLAYAIAPDAGFYSRPEVRFFATYFHASDYNTKSWNGINKGISNHDGDRHYKNMFQFGVQGEAWW